MTIGRVGRIQLNLLFFSKHPTCGPHMSGKSSKNPIGGTEKRNGLASNPAKKRKTSTKSLTVAEIEKMKAATSLLVLRDLSP